MPTLPSLEQAFVTCEQCGYRMPRGEPTCPMCGRLLRTTSEPPPPLESSKKTKKPPKIEFTATIVEEEPPRDETPILGLPRPLFFLALGAALAPIFTWTPILCYMGWFLASLVHEMGHTTAAWLLGFPAVPAIRLDGHAATSHQQQVVILALAITAALVGLAGWFRHRLALLVTFAAAALVHPAIAFTGAAQLVHLASGQLGELAFATVCFWRTLSGGFTRSSVERGAYGAIGWYLLGKNVVLDAGLVFSEGSRAEYGETGSFGLTNDLIRIAQDVVGCSLESVAGVMGLLALLVLPVAWVIWKLRPH